MRAVVGHSQEIDSSEATEEVLRQCREQLGSERPRAALVFASVEYDHSILLAKLSAAWPGLPVIGSTTDGEVSSQAGYLADSVLVVLLAGDDIRAEAGLGNGISVDTSRAVREACAGLRGRRPALCLTTFAPSGDGNRVVQELQRELGPGCPIVGGLSGDHRTYGRMMEFHGQETLRDSLPVLFLFGDLRVSWGVASGWFPIGEFRTVTRSEGHLVHEIDGRPSLDVFRHYWGEVNTESLGEYPLAVYPLGKQGPYTLRAALACDPATGSIRFAGDVPQGSLVRLTEVLPDGILSGTTQSIEAALASYEGKEPELALMFSCAARRWVLGTRAERELELLGKVLGARARELVRVAGFYCFGEIAPLDPVGGAELRNGFHNETCVTVLLGK